MKKNTTLGSSVVLDDGDASVDSDDSDDQSSEMNPADQFESQRPCGSNYHSKFVKTLNYTQNE